MQRDRGASLVEYALIAAACAAAIITAAIGLHGEIRDQFDHVTTTTPATPWAPPPPPPPPADPTGLDPPRTPEQCTWTVDDDGDGVPATATGPCD